MSQQLIDFIESKGKHVEKSQTAFLYFAGAGGSLHLLERLKVFIRAVNKKIKKLHEP